MRDDGRRSARRGRLRGSASTSSRASSTVAASPSKKTTSVARAAGRSSIVTWSAPQGSSPAPTRPDERRARARAPRDGRACRCGRGTPCGRRSRRSVAPRGRAKATRPANSPFHGLRAKSAPVAGSISVTTNGAEALRELAEHPFGIRRDRQPPGAAGAILDLRARDLDRIVDRHELEEFERDPVRGVLEAAVALTVARE